MRDSGADAAAETLWSGRAWTLLAGLMTLRVMYLWLVPFDLAVDEAYYWDWGRQPAWGYYSKPPLIAWVNTLTQALGLNSTQGVRLPAVVLGTLGLGAVFILARRMWGARVGFWTLLLAAAAPGNVALNTLMTIDAPLLASWAVAAAGIWAAVNAELGFTGRSGATEGSSGQAPTTGRRRAWVVYLAAVAIGTLGKQMMLAFPVLVLAWLASGKRERALLRRPRIWLLVAAPTLSIVPTLLWNAHHGWITARHMEGHFQTEPWKIGRALGWLGEWIGAELGVIGPVVAIAFVVTAWRVLRRWRETDSATRMLWIFSALPLFCIGLLTLRQHVEPNWPAAFWLAGVMLAARALVGGWDISATAPATRDEAADAKPTRGLASGRWLPWAVGTGGGLAVLIMTWVVLIGPLGLRGTKLDATARLEGWREVAGAVAEIRAARASQTGVLPWILVVGDRNTVCELAFYLPDQPRVYRFPSEGHPVSQYELWSNPAQDGLAKDEALVLVRNGGDLPPAVRACFAQVTSAGDLRVPVGTHGRAHIYTLWRARGYTPPTPPAGT